MLEEEDEDEDDEVVLFIVSALLFSLEFSADKIFTSVSREATCLRSTLLSLSLEASSACRRRKAAFSVSSCDSRRSADISSSVSFELNEDLSCSSTCSAFT
jgi:hypothetical protein